VETARVSNYHYSDLTCDFETKAEANDTATFSGIASTSDVDAHNDIVEAGAFAPIPMKSNGEPDVLMLRDHDRSQIVGGWTRFEQRGGELHVEGELCLAVEKARETYALMRRGFLRGLSVAFNIPTNGIKRGENGRRHITKATLRECSIVAFPANLGARVLNVKSDVASFLASRGFADEDVNILIDEGLEALIEQRKEQSARKPFGDVDYADPGYQEDGVKRYPIDTEARIRAAWSYINVPRNQTFYTRDQVERIKRRIIAAWKRQIDPDGPPAAQEDSERQPAHAKDLILAIDGNFPVNEAIVAEAARELLLKLRGHSHG
jgi:uncharacterized protein